MSRIGKNPVILPKGAKAELKGQLLRVEGPKGKLERTVAAPIQIEIAGDHIQLSRKDDSPQVRALHGTERALVQNMVKGVTDGFVKELDLIGVGYRADMAGNSINLALGYSHTIDFPLPPGIKGSVIKEGREVSIRVEGSDKQLVGQVAAQIRSLREPEPYKGKGVRYKGEYIKLKAGKAGKK